MDKFKIFFCSCRMEVVYYEKQYLYNPIQAKGVSGNWGSQISRQSVHEVGKFVSSTTGRL
jgi:hypothetical protein